MAGILNPTASIETMAQQGKREGPIREGISDERTWPGCEGGDAAAPVDRRTMKTTATMKTDATSNGGSLPCSRAMREGKWGRGIYTRGTQSSLARESVKIPTRRGRRAGGGEGRAMPSASTRANMRQEGLSLPSC